MELRTPTLDLLESYKAALQKGWSHDNLRDVSAEELAEIETDPHAFLASKTDPGGGGLVTLPDGSRVQRLPNQVFWMWDGEFCGGIGLRWQKGTNDLPSFVLGHIGYAVVPWKQRRGYASEALKQVLPIAKKQGLEYVLVSTSPENTPSQKVILSAGGVFLREFNKGPAYGNTTGFLYKIDLI